MVVSRAKHGNPLERLPSMSFNLPQEAGNRGILIFDADGRVTCADPNVFALLDVPPESIPTGSYERDAYEVLKQSFMNPDEYISSCRRLSDNPFQTFEDVFEASAEGRFIHRYTSPLFDQDRRCLGRAEVYSDITKRRALESAAHQAWEDLRTTQEQLVQSEKLRAVGEIASGVAHDFNNTLGVILGNIQLLLRSTSDEGARMRLMAAERAALDGVDTVRRIQEFTKKKSQGRTTSLHINSVVSEVVEMMRPVWQDGANAQGRTVKVDLDLADDVVVSGHGPEMREVLINILLNAIQAMPDGGDIRVSTGLRDDQGWVRIADTGVGMQEEVRNRVFDPFFTTRGVEGTGLGMSIAYGIISRHEGSISIESEPGKGTAVTVFLPATDAEAQPEIPVAEPWPKSAQAARILVVDDEETFAEVLAEMLRECGHEVTLAHSGAEAIELFRRGQFDLVFTDLGMPHMSGSQLAAAIKEMSPGTPVALLTGWGATIGEAELRESAVDVALSKPVNMGSLASVVEEVLGHRTQ